MLFLRGVEKILRARLDHHKHPPFARNLTSASKSIINYVVIVDFEATCVPNNGPGTFISEIIEFPAILIDVKAKKIVSEKKYTTFYNDCLCNILPRENLFRLTRFTVFVDPPRPAEYFTNTV